MERNNNVINDFAVKKIVVIDDIKFKGKYKMILNHVHIGGCMDGKKVPSFYFFYLQ